MLKGDPLQYICCEKCLASSERNCYATFAVVERLALRKSLPEVLILGKHNCSWDLGIRNLLPELLITNPHQQNRFLAYHLAPSLEFRHNLIVPDW